MLSLGKTTRSNSVDNFDLTIIRRDTPLATKNPTDISYLISHHYDILVRGDGTNPFYPTPCAFALKLGMRVHEAPLALCTETPTVVLNAGDKVEEISLVETDACRQFGAVLLLSYWCAGVKRTIQNRFLIAPMT